MIGWFGRVKDFQLRRALQAPAVARQISAKGPAAGLPVAGDGLKMGFANWLLASGSLLSFHQRLMRPELSQIKTLSW